MVGIGVEEGGGAGVGLINYLEMLGQNGFFYYYCYGDTLDQASNCICAWNAGCYFGRIL